MYAQHLLRSRLWLTGLLILSLTAWSRGGHTQIAPPFKALHSFNGADGANPYAGLIQGKDGDLYGATAYSGGTVFRITTSGAFTPLNTLPSARQEGGPQFSLLQGKDGDLYGTTRYGGGGYGSVFKITTDGTDFSILYPFTGGDDGSEPLGSLIQGKDGDLYGTTLYGGTNDYGTIFKITTTGAPTVLYSFPGGLDGAYPLCNLIQGRDGNLYGTCSQGGTNNTGTVFQFTTSGALNTLYNFSALPGGTNADGYRPYAGLTEGKDGNLYGAATGGGTHGDGTVFKLTMVPVITSFSPTTGSVGTSVTVKGHNFTEATLVKFGIIRASFTINSDTSLTFVVPAPGAASARILVANPFGEGTSSKVFTMAPVITSFRPTTGPVGTVVTLKGANFTGATAVSLGAIPAASFTINSDTSLTFTVAAGAVTAQVTVVNSYGTGTSHSPFTVTP